MPVQIMPHMYRMLADEIQWALDDVRPSTPSHSSSSIPPNPHTRCWYKERAVRFQVPPLPLPHLPPHRRRGRRAPRLRAPPQAPEAAVRPLARRGRVPLPPRGRRDPQGTPARPLRPRPRPRTCRSRAPRSSQPTRWTMPSPARSRATPRPSGSTPAAASCSSPPPVSATSQPRSPRRTPSLHSTLRRSRSSQLYVEYCTTQQPFLPHTRTLRASGAANVRKRAIKCGLYTRRA